MLTHATFWQALDTLAAERGLTPSGLARAAGLDPTAFNRSKRAAPGGAPRWPGVGTLARVLDAAGIDLATFAALVGGAPVLRSADRRGADRIRTVPFSRLGEEELFDDHGQPAGGAGWDERPLPVPAEPGCYAVLADGDALEPAWRRDSVLLVSPAPRAAPGDRVLRWDREPGSGRMRVSAAILSPSAPDGAAGAVRVHRILWASF